MVIYNFAQLVEKLSNVGGSSQSDLVLDWYWDCNVMSGVLSRNHVPTIPGSCCWAGNAYNGKLIGAECHMNWTN